MEAEKIVQGIYMIAGGDISSPEDASAFILDCSGELCMIDCGAGKSAAYIVENIEETDLHPSKITNLILTHCHVDHIGAASYLKEKYDVRVAAHDLDSEAIETGDPRRTASGWYGIRLPGVKVDTRLTGKNGAIDIGNRRIKWLHTPGHTPGSIAVYVDDHGQRILFGQDIHGPFDSDFDSDIIKWRESMADLIELEADILCEGHFGIFSPKEKVRKYIQSYLDRYAG